MKNIMNIEFAKLLSDAGMEITPEEMHSDSAQKNTKSFENYVLKLALLSRGEVMSIDESIRMIESTDDFKKISQKHKLQVVNTVIQLNTKFGKVWESGYNANFQNIPEPLYGTKSAKADIVLISGGVSFGFSIKMDADFVIVSAQNTDEFEGIFYCAISKYKEDNPELDLYVLKSYIQPISDVVGRVVTRPLNPSHFNKVKDGIHDEWIEQLSNTIYEENKFIEDENTIVRKAVDKDCKTLQSKIKEFPNLMNYIIHEGLTANLKYGGKLPCAEYVLCPTGCYSVKNYSTEYVNGCSEVADMRVRGMNHGKMRSSSEIALKPFWNTNTDMSHVYSTLNKMTMSLKWDVRRNSLMKVL